MVTGGGQVALFSWIACVSMCAQIKFKMTFKKNPFLKILFALERSNFSSLNLILFLRESAVVREGSTRDTYSKLIAGKMSF